MSIKLTCWYPTMNGLTPKYERPGLYEVKVLIRGTRRTFDAWAYWDGNHFRGGAMTPAKALNLRAADFLFGVRAWRGVLK